MQKCHLAPLSEPRKDGADIDGGTERRTPFPHPWSAFLLVKSDRLPLLSQIYLSDYLVRFANRQSGSQDISPVWNIFGFVRRSSCYRAGGGAHSGLFGLEVAAPGGINGL
jgi:hypothetical protein